MGRRALYFIVVVALVLCLMLPATGPVMAQTTNSVAMILAVNPSTTTSNGTLYYTVTLINQNVPGANNVVLNVTFFPPGPTGAQGAYGTAVTLDSDKIIAIGETVVYNWDGSGGALARPALAVDLGAIPLDEGVTVVYAASEYDGQYIYDPPYVAHEFDDIPADIGYPGIDLEKYVSVDNGVTWLDADSAPGPIAIVGEDVKFMVTICNNGSVPLTNISVSDTDFAFTGVVTSLAPGACDNSSIVTVPAVAGQQWDVANVTAQADGAPVFDEDPAYYTGLTSGIDIEKYVSVDGGVTWLDADSAPGPTALVGNNVSFYVSVCNTGTANLTNILVSDTDFAFTGVVTSLAPGACDNSSIVTVPAVAGQQWDVANVTAQADGAPVFDEDPAYYFGSAPLPAIDIEKHTNDVDADTAPGPYISINGSVTWTYIVTNTGNVDLTSVNVTDDQLGPIGTIAFLAVNATQTLYAYGTAVAGQYANNATVEGYYEAGNITVSNWDPSHYYNRPTTVGWGTYPVDKLRVLLPWIALLAAVVAGASLLVVRHRRAHSPGL